MNHRDQDPWCAMCLDRGLYVPWTQLDHIIPLFKGGPDTDDNLQGLCDPCHGIKTRKDLGQRAGGCDENGNPVDPEHHWNQ